MPRPLKAIRLKCLDCCGGSSKCVKFCTEGGITSSMCSLWPYRFGMRPATAKARFGSKYLTPGELPSHDVPLEECETPQEPQKASGAEKPARP